MNGKNILIINGSPQRTKSRTLKVAKALASGICKGGDPEPEIIHVSDLHITPCTGCLSCWGRTEGRCAIQNDDVQSVRKKIEKADVVIASFPLFFFGLPGQVKLLLDRLLVMFEAYEGQRAPDDGSPFHRLRHRAEGKKLIIVSSCAYTQAEKVFEPLLGQLEYIFGKKGFSAILCPQLQTMADLGEGRRFTNYLSRFERAGQEFAKEGIFSESTLQSLSKPPFPEDTYKTLIDSFWAKEKSDVKS